MSIKAPVRTLYDLGSWIGYIEKRFYGKHKISNNTPEFITTTANKMKSKIEPTNHLLGDTDKELYQKFIIFSTYAKSLR